MLAGAAQQASASGHDCCSDGAAPGVPDQQPSNQMGDCMMGQAWRTAPAMAPTVEPIRVAMPLVSTGGQIVSDTGVASRAPEEFWRPPRTI